MGTLSNKYFNAQAVEEALDKGVAAYDNMGRLSLCTTAQTLDLITRESTFSRLLTS